MDVVNKYYNTNLVSKTPVVKTKYSPQQFTFDARMVKTPLVDPVCARPETT
jgi:hypothetical protein